jgi:hypothetical protein
MVENDASAVEFWQGLVTIVRAVLHRSVQGMYCVGIATKHGGRSLLGKRCRLSQCDDYSQMQMMKRRSLQVSAEGLAPPNLVVLCLIQTSGKTRRGT